MVCLFKLLLLLCLYSQACNSQSITPAIKEQAQKATSATISRDYETLIQFTYPSLVQAAGGKEKMKDIIQKVMTQMDLQRISFQSITIGEPGKVYKGGDEIFSIVPETVTLNVQGGKLINNSFLLAVSMDNGSRWYFIEADRINQSNIKSFFPNWNSELKLPEKQKAIFIPN